MAEEKLPLIKVVGMSASGKSTLVQGLRAAGYRARPVSQEHSNIPDLWHQFDRPFVLIYLHVDLAGQRRRRPDVSWSREAWHLEWERLAHARSHADLRIDTGDLTPDQVLEIALRFLRRLGVAHADHPLPPVPATGSGRANVV